MANFPGQGPFDPHASRPQAAAGAFNPNVPRIDAPVPATAKAAAVAHPVVVAPVVGQRRREVLNPREYELRQASFSATHPPVERDDIRVLTRTFLEFPEKHQHQ